MDAFNEKDKSKRLEAAEELINQKGIMGSLIRGTLGEEGVAEVNEALQMAQEAQQNASAAANASVIATADVLDVAGKNVLVMNQPLVTLTLRVHQVGVEPYVISLDTTVSGVQIPHIGDRVNLGQNPAKPYEFIYLGIKAQY